MRLRRVATAELLQQVSQSAIDTEYRPGGPDLALAPDRLSAGRV